MEKLPASSHKTMPWKNGGGSTTEIARSPAGESLEAFDWRVSAARVERAGPFSRFVGVDRTLVVLRGSLSLAVEGRGVVDLDEDAAPFSFAGDVGVDATLAAGSVEDFNVMTRRDRFAHAVRKERVHGSARVEASADVVLVFVGRGSCEVRGGRLEERDALVLRGGETAALSSTAPCDLVVVELRALPR